MTIIAAAAAAGDRNGGCPDRALRLVCESLWSSCITTYNTYGEVRTQWLLFSCVAFLPISGGPQNGTAPFAARTGRKHSKRACLCFFPLQMCLQACVGVGVCPPECLCVSVCVCVCVCVCVRAEVCARTRGCLSCVLLVLRCFLWFFPRFCFFVCFDVCVRWRLVSLLVCWLYYMFYNSIFVRVFLFCLCTWRGVWMFACLCLCLLCFSFVLHVFLRVSVCVCVSKT